MGTPINNRNGFLCFLFVSIQNGKGSANLIKRHSALAAPSLGLCTRFLLFFFCVVQKPKACWMDFQLYRGTGSSVEGKGRQHQCGALEQGKRVFLVLVL